MDLKKIGKALLFPHIALMLLLIPVSVMFLVYSMVVLGTKSAVAIVSYVLAAYTLTVWCFKIPYLIKFFKSFKNENKYARRWIDDDRLRVKTSLYTTLIWNTAYAVFQLWLGFYHRTFWFCSLAVYYFSLAVMRLFLARHTSKNERGAKIRSELIKYSACGWIFLVMNLVLTVIIFFMVYWNRTFVHHEITTIAMAAFTFTSFSLAIVNMVKYRKYNSPVYSASKAISLASACVSILTLESTMLTTWGQSESPEFRRLMLALTGVAVSVFVLAMAVYMIVKGNRGLKELKTIKEKNNG